MRLTALARKIDVTPRQLITFLENNGIDISSGLHTKLNDHIIEMVLHHFAPELQTQDDKDTPVKEGSQADALEVTPSEETESNDLKLSEKNEEEKEVEEKAEIEPLIISSEKDKTGTIEDLETGNSEDIELIKVKKVKLEGIKVVGKIELPEKPKKEEVKNREDEQVEKVEEPKKKEGVSNKKFDKSRRRNTRSKNRKPLTYEEKLKQEEREKLKKRRRKENQEKLRKKKFYEHNIKPKTLQKPKKRKKKKYEREESVSQKQITLYRNPIKRFWAWLNGKYDRY